ncbi:hypothetical protein BC828DRAFT_388919 [Blastocladiella britannica]|nr:hypothetical protein BC828DRAFT_388919 [Blastocladiella britannica]
MADKQQPQQPVVAAPLPPFFSSDVSKFYLDALPANLTGSGMANVFADPFLATPSTFALCRPGDNNACIPRYLPQLAACAAALCPSQVSAAQTATNAFANGTPPSADPVLANTAVAAGDALQLCVRAQCPMQFVSANALACVSLDHPALIANNVSVTAQPPFAGNNASGEVDLDLARRFRIYMTRSVVRQRGTAADVRAVETADPLQLNSVGVCVPSVPLGVPCNASGRLDMGSSTKPATGALLGTASDMPRNAPASFYDNALGTVVALKLGTASDPALAVSIPQAYYLPSTTCLNGFVAAVRGVRSGASCTTSADCLLGTCTAQRTCDFSAAKSNVTATVLAIASSRRTDGRKFDPMLTAATTPSATSDPSAASATGDTSTNGMISARGGVLQMVVLASILVAAMGVYIARRRAKERRLKQSLNAFGTGPARVIHWHNESRRRRWRPWVLAKPQDVVVPPEERARELASAYAGAALRGVGSDDDSDDGDVGSHQSQAASRSARGLGGWSPHSAVPDASAAFGSASPALAAASAPSPLLPPPPPPATRRGLQPAGMRIRGHNMLEPYVDGDALPLYTLTTDIVRRLSLLAGLDQPLLSHASLSTAPPMPVAPSRPRTAAGAASHPSSTASASSRSSWGPISEHDDDESDDDVRPDSPLAVHPADRDASAAAVTVATITGTVDLADPVLVHGGGTGTAAVGQLPPVYGAHERHNQIEVSPAPSPVGSRAASLMRVNSQTSLVRRVFERQGGEGHATP